jgi:hypothetical protein
MAEDLVYNSVEPSDNFPLLEDLDSNNDSMEPYSVSELFVSWESNSVWAKVLFRLLFFPIEYFILPSLFPSLDYRISPILSHVYLWLSLFAWLNPCICPEFA